MHILLFFLLAPMGAGALLEYALCRFPKKRAWRRLPPMILAAAAFAVTVFRHFGWDRGGGGAPIETLLFFPGLPALGIGIGLLVGWLVWRRLWLPRVVTEKKRRWSGGNG